MAPSTLPTIALLAFTYIFYRLIHGVITGRRFRKFAKQHGCEEPLDTTGSFPYGWETVLRLIRMNSTGEDILDDILLGDMKDGIHTLQKTIVDGKAMVITSEPANMQAILATQFSEFEIGPARRATFIPLLGNSIFSSDGAIWKHSRALLRPAFARDNINNLDATSQCADALIRVLGAADPSGWTRAQDMLPLFFCFTLDTSVEFLFGEHVGALEAYGRSGGGQSSAAAARKEGAYSAAVAVSSDFYEALTEANEGTAKRIRMGNLYWLYDGPRFRRSVGAAKKFVGGFVEKALARLESEGKAAEGKEEHGLLESLTAQTRNREDLVSQTLAVMAAGRDTTASMMGWCVRRLALHPDIFTSLREAVLRDFPPGTQPDFAELKACKPLQHFMSEILRLHPVVPINNRLCVKDTTLPLGGGADQRSPIAIRAGQSVVFSVYATHRRTDLWGDDALDFRPSRWEQKVPPWQYSPFMGGPRICIGQQFALTEAGFLLVRLLQAFDAVEAVDMNELKKMTKSLGLTMWPADGANVRWHKAAA